MAGRIKDADKLIEIIDDDIASLDKNMSREGYDVCLCTLKMAKQYINALPTIEAEPIKHGYWYLGNGKIGGEFHPIKPNDEEHYGEYVKVVRCKDCIYFYKYGFKLEYTECKHFDCDVCEDGFCAWGEQKEVEK